ncbi:hypothetical protein C8J57DRAFT_1730487 [Mycena rebaudengoi]|nr:hypothetical protein C8J57DRAFT_1730487 [Mycena rebaudengoi]
MPITTIRSATTKDRPYLQAIASISLLIMETAQRVKENKEEVKIMIERAYEFVCAVINICHDSEADGRLWRPIWHHRCSHDGRGADAICYHPVATSVADSLPQKDASKRHKELITILDKKKHPKRSSDSSSSGGSPPPPRARRSHAIYPIKADTASFGSSTLSLIPASPKIFHGRDEELEHVVNTMLHAPAGAAARIAIVGPDGVGKTALTLAAAHDPQIRERFGQNRFFVDCTAAGDEKQLISLMAAQLDLEEPAGRKAIFKHLAATATAEALLSSFWTPSAAHGSLKWTRPFLPTLNPLPADAARTTFLDISDIAPDDPGLDPLLALTENMPRMITRMAGLAAFEGCTSLVARWEKEGPTLLCETMDKGSEGAPLQIVPEAPLTEEPQEIHVHAAATDTDTPDSPSKTPVAIVELPPPPPELSPETERLLLSFLAPRPRTPPRPSIASVLGWRRAAGVGVTTWSSARRLMTPR